MSAVSVLKIAEIRQLRAGGPNDLQRVLEEALEDVDGLRQADVHDAFGAGAAPQAHRPSIRTTASSIASDLRGILVLILFSFL